MQIHRLIEIVYILLDKEKVTADKLAEKFEVSRRTVYRDVEMLSAAGIPIVMNKGYGGGISLLKSFTLDKTVFSQNEREEIMSALSALRAVTPHASDSGTLSKLAGLFGDGVSEWVEVDFGSWYNSASEAEKFELIKNAVTDRKTVEFDYASSENGFSQRKVAPVRLCFKGQAWYLYAFCFSRSDYRFFKLSRIKNITAGEQKHLYRIKDRILKQTEYYKEEMLNVKLRLSNASAYRVYEEFSDYVRDSDGFFTVKACLPHNVWLLNYLISFNGDCEILEPSSLKKELESYLEKILNKIK